MKKAIVLAGMVFILILTVLSFKPFEGGRNACRHIKGKVISIFEAGFKDAVFTIAGENANYYINRGFEKQFTLSELKTLLQGKEITILYEENWSPLIPYQKNKHISEILLNNELLYSELPK
jgi:hypothetical protein